MTIRNTVTLLPEEDYSHLEPLPAPEPEIDIEYDMRQSNDLFDLVEMLRRHYGDRDDVLIAGGGYVRQEATDDAERFAPDLVVTFGVRSDAIIDRNGYVISEVGKPPDWVLEIASRSTGQRDYTVKREGYASYGIAEYWRFDHTGGQWHDAPLAGDRLVEGEYVPIELTREGDGVIWGFSPALGLDLCWADGEMRLRVPESGEYLATSSEARGMLEDAELGRERALDRAFRAETERDALENENRRLRDELRRLRGE